MLNINTHEIILSKDEIKERIQFFKDIKESNRRIPNFKFVYRTTLLTCIQKCKDGYNDIKNIYDISLEILEALNVKIDYEKALEDMYNINEEEIKTLPNIRLLDNSIHGILVKIL